MNIPAIRSSTAESGPSNGVVGRVHAGAIDENGQAKINRKDAERGGNNRNAVFDATFLVPLTDSAIAVRRIVQCPVGENARRRKRLGDCYRKHNQIQFAH